MNRLWNVLLAGNAISQQLRANSRTLIAASLVLLGLQSASLAQIGAFFPRVVGGVSIDADGVVRNVSVEENAQWMQMAKQNLAGGKGDFAKPAEIRHVSLKHIAAEVAKAERDRVPVSEELAFLGGLTRIEYVLIYPESNDIVLAGPAESWVVGVNGAVVGAKSGQPVMQLQDLIEAFARINSPRPESISCSIEPTKEGSARLNQFLEQVKLGPGQNPIALEGRMQEAFGPQQVLFTGVTGDSHIGRVIFGADYQMKRIGMKLRESPVRGVPSYVDMLRHANPPKNQSRWWFACDYNKVERSEDSLAWHLSGPGVKLMTEDEVVQSDGSRVGTGGKNAVADKWAGIFSSKIDQLAAAEPVFGELRTVMDLCVVASLIRSHGLEEMAQCDLSTFRNVVFDNSDVEQKAPTQVDPQCSFIKAGSSWIVTASGGVLIDPWALVREPSISTNLSPVRAKAAPNVDSWSWN